MKRNPRAHNVDSEAAEAKRLEKLLASQAQRDDEVAVFVLFARCAAHCVRVGAWGLWVWMWVRASCVRACVCACV